FPRLLGSSSTILSRTKESHSNSHIGNPQFSTSRSTKNNFRIFHDEDSPNSFPLDDMSLPSDPPVAARSSRSVWAPPHAADGIKFKTKVTTGPGPNDSQEHIINEAQDYEGHGIIKRMDITVES